MGSIVRPSADRERGGDALARCDEQRIKYLMFWRKAEQALSRVSARGAMAESDLVHNSIEEDRELRERLLLDYGRFTT